VPVKYNPSNPSRARIDKPGRLWAAPAALIGAGAVVTALALV